jgi:hypothetical protein
MKFEITSLKFKYEPTRDRRNEPYRYKNKLYIWPEGESIMENLFSRHDRPSKVWKEEIIPAVLDQIREEDEKVYNIMKEDKWGWRQKCGCSCPCSPGFVGGEGNYYISATVKFL